MTENAVVRARIDEATKSEAAAAKALPFEPFVPNTETVEAMKAARRGDVVAVGRSSRLLASLNADC